MKMKIPSLLCLLVAAIHAAPSPDPDISVLEPATRYMPVLEGAPKYPGSRIVNGNQASRGQFPHQAALYLDGRSFCGGVPHFDNMGADSCPLHFGVCGIGTTTVHLGSQNLNSVEAGKVTVTTRSHVNHANYDTNNLNNDISLLRLPFSITLGSFIQVVALPRHSQDSNTFADQAVQVSGWGRTSDTSTGISAELNFVDLNIITNAVCAQTYGTDVIIGSTMCASGAGGRSTCNGDSGGPLVITQEGSYLQIGVVSFVSSAGCASGNPSGYVRTTSFLKWISANTQISIAD